jgi:CubicO group peptidase (beta-lactamase class C family)
VNAVVGTAWLALLLSTVAPVAAAQNLALDQRVKQSLTFLEMWLDGQRVYEQIPGISVAVVHDQQLVWAAGFGEADRERKVAASPQTVYSICSISKLFTAIAVMQLRDEGKLRLDDPIKQHLPWFQMKRTYPGSAPITVESLLTHSAGFQQDPPIAYWTGAFNFPSSAQIRESLKDAELLFPVGRHSEYSNTAYILAGEIVAAASGTTYAERVKSRIIEPLGLTNTTPDMPAELRGGRLAIGYSGFGRDGKRVQLPFFQTRGLAPAAGFASSATDLARFASWQFGLLGSGASDVLDANTLREMQRVHFPDSEWSQARGLGFRVWRSKDRTFVGHGGDCPGFRTAMLLQPEERIATIFLGNASGIANEDFAERIYEIMAPAIRAAVAGEPITARADTSLAAFAGSYDYAPWGGEMLVFPWEDGLAFVDLPNMNPQANIVRLHAVSGKPGIFQRIRKDGSVVESITFTHDADGRVIGLVRGNNPLPKLGGRESASRAH